MSPQLREACRLRKWFWRMQVPGVPVEMVAHVLRQLRALLPRLTPEEHGRLERLDDRLVMAWARAAPDPEG